MKFKAFILFLVVLIFVTGCIATFRKIDVTEHDPAEPPVRVEHPLKVFLSNGDVLLYPDGATFRDNQIFALGTLRSSDTATVPTGPVSLDSVEVMTSFESRVLQPGGIMVSLVGTAALAATGFVLAKAIFGSCPTVYSGPEGEGVLEAELFSNSIARLFEHRDVDKLSIQPDENGVITLDVRNEALETHYINHLELLEVAHGEEELVVPGPLNEAYILEELVPPEKATDLAGNNVLEVIATGDKNAFESDPAVLAAVDSSRLFDHIELEIARPASDTMGIYLEVRTSLLTTVLFYEYMLASQGVNALNWLTNDLNDISTIIEMTEWFQKRSGLRVEVWNGTAYQEVDRVLEVGPIAWKPIAIPFAVPNTGDEKVKVRLTFIADAWRIDRVAFAKEIKEGTYRAIPASALLDTDRVPQSLDPILMPDDERLITTAGERYWIEFDAGTHDDEMERTYFIAGLGYYTEWIRGDWVREQANGPAFKASDEILLAAIEQWRSVKDEFELQFESTKIPVR